MKVTKLISFFAGIAVCGVCFASDEVLLMATSDGIAKYDIESGEVVGQFGSSYGSFVDVAVDPTHFGQALAISSTGSVNRFDYRSGELLSSFNVSPASEIVRPKISVMNNGNLLYTSFDSGSGISSTRMLDSSGNLLRDFGTGNIAFQQLAAQQTGDGSVRILQRSQISGGYQFSLVSYNLSGDLIGTAIVGSAASANYISELNHVAGGLMASSGIGSSEPTDAKIAFGPGYTNFNGFPFLSYSSIGGLTNWTSSLNGTGFMVHSQPWSAGIQNKLYVYSPDLGSASTNFVTMPVSSRVFSSAMAPVPEMPVAYAFGIGIVGLIARRRSRK